MGVSPLTIYHWEHGKARPRNKEMLAKWLAVRELGKREALRQLGLGKSEAPEAKVSKAKSKTRRRGTFARTAEESILALLKARKSLTTSQLNDAWRKEGRAGTANVTLGRLVTARKLKRVKAKGARGSLYRAS